MGKAARNARRAARQDGAAFGDDWTPHQIRKHLDAEARNRDKAKKETEKFLRLVSEIGRLDAVSALGIIAVETRRLCVDPSPSNKSGNRSRLAYPAMLSNLILRYANTSGAGSAMQNTELRRMIERVFQTLPPNVKSEYYSGRITEMLAAIMTPQLEFQLIQTRELGRTWAILSDYRRGSMPTLDEWESYLHVPLKDFLVFTSAIESYVLLSRDEGIRKSYLVALFCKITGCTEASATKCLETHFVSALPDLKNEALKVSLEEPEHALWTYNPLRSKPLVDLGDDVLLCPVIPYVPRRANLTSLYFDGLKMTGNSFTMDLGLAFEDYLVEVFDKFSDVCQVHSEIVFGKSQRKSVDFVLVFDEVVILVEAKIARQIEATRLGTSRGRFDSIKKLTKAQKQIDSTAKLIRSGHPAFAAIPSDRPLVGLIVGLEPFWLASSGASSFSLFPEGDVPTIIDHVSELEVLAERIDELGQPGLRLRELWDQDKSRLSSLVSNIVADPLPALEVIWEYLEASIEEVLASPTSPNN